MAKHDFDSFHGIDAGIDEVLNVCEIFKLSFVRPKNLYVGARGYIFARNDRGFIKGKFLDELICVEMRFDWDLCIFRFKSKSEISGLVFLNRMG